MELKLDRNKTYGLALEGGGAKGAYQIGAWKALREAGIRFSAVSGTSVGALNGAMIVMDDLQKAEDVWNNIHFSQVMDVDDVTSCKDTGKARFTMLVDDRTIGERMHSQT